MKTLSRGMKVIVDGDSPRGEFGHLLRYESCYHINPECSSLRLAKRPVTMIRDKALSSGRLMCGMCRMDLAHESQKARDENSFFTMADASEGLVFPLRGSYEQTLIVSAVRKAIGTEGAMERTCRERVSDLISTMSPSTAHLIAREIREWWCDWVWEDGTFVRSGYQSEDTYGWTGLLFDLDARAARCSTNRGLRPEIPFGMRDEPVAYGEDAWSRAPEVIRPQEHEVTCDVGETTVELVGESAQSLLVMASRYCFGRTSYMPGLTCDVLRGHIGCIEPRVAARIAQDVREWWLDYYEFDWPEVENELSFDVVSCWLGMLGALDERAGDVAFPEGHDVTSWEDVSVAIRPIAARA